MAYANRVQTKTADGKTTNETEADRMAEREVAARLCGLMGWEYIKYKGQYAPVDGWFRDLKTGLMRINCEVKHRDCLSRWRKIAEEGVFLNLRKYEHLVQYELRDGVPSVYVVRFRDWSYWIPVREVIATPDRIKLNAGCRDWVKGGLDVEDCICIPLEEMRRLHSIRWQGTWLYI